MTSILQLVETLVRDPGAKAAYAAEPDAYLAQRGFGELEPDDIGEALIQVADSLPPALAAQFDPADGLGSLAAVDLADLGLADTADFSVDPRPLPIAEREPDGADEPGSGDELDDEEPTSDPPGSTLELPTDVDFDRLDEADERIGRGNPDATADNGDADRLDPDEVEPGPRWDDPREPNDADDPVGVAAGLASGDADQGAGEPAFAARYGDEPFGRPFEFDPDGDGPAGWFDQADDQDDPFLPTDTIEPELDEG